MKLILATPKNLNEIFDLFIKKEQWFQSQGINQWVGYTSDKRFPKSYFLRQIEEKKLYALSQDRTITACCVVCDQDKEFGEKQNNCLYLKNLVSGQKGAGSKLLDLLSDKFRQEGIEALLLVCRDDNNELKNFYQKNGFDEVGKVPFDEEDMACRFCKKLTNN